MQHRINFVYALALGHVSRSTTYEDPSLRSDNLNNLKRAISRTLLNAKIGSAKTGKSLAESDSDLSPETLTTQARSQFLTSLSTAIILADGDKTSIHGPGPGDNTGIDRQQEWLHKLSFSALRHARDLVACDQPTWESCESSFQGEVREALYESVNASDTVVIPEAVVAPYVIDLMLVCNSS